MKDITAKEAFLLIENNKNTVLIDVRTEAEWLLGVPLLDESKILFIQWRTAPLMIKNDEFISKLTSRIKDKNTKMFFLCRSGVRSYEAANACLAEGYTNCYNIIDGFEGKHQFTGWKNSGLAWQKLSK